MREVETRAAAGDPDAGLAFDVYVHRLVAGIAAMAAAVGGLDVLAFTGGVGRALGPGASAAAERLAWLGVAVDPVRNDTADADTTSRCRRAASQVVVVTAREDLQIAREARGVLGRH